ncbi:MAG: nodulation protein NfeD [Myxococcales bacterium]|nr:nodulation protein NfeD [Myxococcales bacterium]
MRPSLYLLLATLVLLVSQSSYASSLGVAQSEAPADEALVPGPLYCDQAAVCDFPFSFDDQAHFVVVEIKGEVSLGMASYIKRAIRHLRAGDHLILDINTFGGRIDAAVMIRDALLGLESKGSRTIAFVHPRAISAGALIALATDIIVVAPGSSIGAATPVQIAEGGEMEPVEEKVVSYMRAEIRSTAEARGRRGDIAEAMVDADQNVAGLIGEGKLLTLDGRQALQWGIASFGADDLTDLMSTLGYGTDAGQNGHSLETLHWSWAERLGGWLSGSAISSLLMSIGMLALMIGLYTGGSPVPLSIGGLCLGLFFFGHYAVHLAGLEEILIFVAGTGLILAEVLMPGQLVLGAAGLVLVLVSLGLGLVSADAVPFNVQWELGLISSAVARVSGSLLATVGVGIVAARLLPRTTLGKALGLEARLHGRSHSEGLHKLVGACGQTQSPLRPSGRIVIGNKHYDALAEGGFIEPGQQVKVLRHKGFSLVVRVVPGQCDSDDAPRTTEEHP